MPTATPVLARRFGRRPVAAQIEAYIGPKPDGVTTIATWNARITGKDLVTLNVTNLRILSGNIAYFNLISAFAPYRVPFSLLGDKQIVRQISDAPAGQQLRISGNFVLTTVPGTLMLSGVEVMAALTPTQSTPEQRTPVPD